MNYTVAVLSVNLFLEHLVSIPPQQLEILYNSHLYTVISIDCLIKFQVPVHLHASGHVCKNTNIHFSWRMFININTAM